MCTRYICLAFMLPGLHGHGDWIDHLLFAILNLLKSTMIPVKYQIFRGSLSDGQVGLRNGDPTFYNQGDQIVRGSQCCPTEDRMLLRYIHFANRIIWENSCMYERQYTWLKITNAQPSIIARLKLFLINEVVLTNICTRWKYDTLCRSCLKLDVFYRFE